MGGQRPSHATEPPAQRQEEPRSVHRPVSQQLTVLRRRLCWSLGLSRRASLACRATSWPDRRREWRHWPPDQMMAVVMCSLDPGTQGSGAGRAINGPMHQMQRDGALNSTIDGTSSVVLAMPGLPFHVLLLSHAAARLSVLVVVASQPESRGSASQRREGRVRGHPYRSAKRATRLPSGYRAPLYLYTVLRPPLSSWVPARLYLQPQRPRPEPCQGRRGSTVRPPFTVRPALTT